MNSMLGHVDLAGTMTRFQQLKGLMLSGLPYTDEEFDEYMDVAEELVFHPSNPMNLSGATLEGIRLAGGIKGFFKKIGKVVKKALPMVVGLVGLVVSIYAPPAGAAIVAAGAVLAGAFSQWSTSKGTVKPPLAVTLVQTASSAGAALNGLGIALPADLQAGLDVANSMLAQIPAKDAQAIKQAGADEILLAATNHGKEEAIAPTMEAYLAAIPTWAYVGGAVVGTAAILAVATALLKPDYIPEMAKTPRRRSA